jgi:glycosyltransferase involved in cell wall biosynthesis
MNKICAVIPAYNEEAHIALVIQKTRKHSVDVIVIDDGSTDRTAAIAEREDVRVIRHIANQGLGAALRGGFKAAIDGGYHYVITLDADGQHDPEDIPRFIEKIIDDKADIVTGNRLHYPKSMPRKRLFVNRTLSRIISNTCGQYIPDALNGYRIISGKVLRSIELNCERFDIVPEVLIKAAKQGFRIESLDIECIYADETSHIRPWRDGRMFFKLIAESKKRR